MSETPEGRVKRLIKMYLKELDCIWVYSPVQMGYGVTGIPDLIGCREGRMFGIEVKAPNRRGRLTALQKVTLELIKAGGGMTCVATCVQDVEDMFANAGPWGNQKAAAQPAQSGAGNGGHSDS